MAMILVIAVWLLLFPSSMIFGIVLVALVGWVLIGRWRVRRTDLLAAASLASNLRKGTLPASISAKDADTRGELLLDNEVCFVGCVQAEVQIFYGNPAVIQKGAVIAWGSPLALMFSAIFTLGFWDHNRKKAKKASPQWREPTQVNLWITSKRLMLKSRRHETSWHFPLDEISACSLERDGLVFVGARSPDIPFKVRTRGAAWCSVLVHYLAFSEVVDVRLPKSVLAANTASGPAFPN